MRSNNRWVQQEGFSLVELLVSVVVMVPIMAAVIGLFTAATNQHSAEQSSAEANIEFRAAMELITQEVAQAGSHRDAATTTTAAIPLQAGVQAVSVASSNGLSVGDYVEVGAGVTKETVQLTAAGSHSISGIFRRAHDNGVPVRLFALPYSTGIIPPNGLGPNSSATATSLRLFGDLNGDGVVYYVRYSYDSAHAQITRSMTPVTQGSVNAAIPLISHVKPNSAQFTLYSDALGVVTAVDVAITLRIPVKNGAGFEETALSSRIVVPSVAAASQLLDEIRASGGVNHLPPTPSQVSTWASQ